MDLTRRNFLKTATAAAIGIVSPSFASNLSAESNYDSFDSFNSRNPPSWLHRELAKLDELPILTERNVQWMIDMGKLVRMPLETGTYFINRDIDGYALATPWNKLFLEDLAGEYNAEFLKRLQVNNLSRTWEHQNRIWNKGKNPDAASPDESGHPRGISGDYGFRRMTGDERNWMDNQLGALKNRWIISAVKERRQGLYHTLVYKDNFLAHLQEKLRMSDEEFRDYYREGTGIPLGRS